MKIDSIGIVGGTNGLGKSFASFFETKFSGAVDILVSGRSTVLKNEDLVKSCDLVIFAVPISQTQSVIESLVPFSRKDQVWMDFTSIKEAPVQSMLSSKAEVCGAHPLFGPVKNIQGQTLVLCPDRIRGASYQAVRNLFSDFQIIESKARAHDELMGMVQNLSHFSDFVLGKTLKDVGADIPALLEFSSPPYRIKLDLLARIFAQNPELYADISSHNQHGRVFEQSFLEAAQFFVSHIKAGHKEIVAQEFMDIKDFLGNDFCDDKFERSQKLLDYENTLNEATVSPSLLDTEVPDNKVFDWAVFGRELSHTDDASLELCSKTDTKSYFQNIFGVFDAVDNDLATYGLVPYENSSRGSVFETLDELFHNRSIHIVGAIERDISQNLMGLPGSKIEDLEVVMSHPQALAQSHHFLRKKAPEAQIKNHRSTALAAHEIVESGDITQGAIGSKRLAQTLGLTLLAEDIEYEDNKTRFIVISKDSTPRHSAQSHTSLVFWFNKDESGSLAKVLSFLAAEGINLQKLDSRRAAAKYGNYLFFIDAEIPLTDFEKKHRTDLQSLCSGIQVLGGF